MHILRIIRHAIAAYRFNRQFREYDKEIASLRKQHKRGVKDAMASKRRAVRLALMGNQVRVKV